ncbi:nucleotidyl transferase AbiEii/AbiGii toxin family protein [Streptomyces aurantiacus]|uniref:Uncharacterized protein n=1 Tax=Streptomyces aurantiacus TaxID=47760 RepID=A0A7G1NWQ1_9ACTN|nr:nucleotidyl transferase AbiEii/AbiGii toxin family protein [Streptomyces aurantiacus]BCL27558.1 hypothetical protein GCM10017557_24170 [Streptomyces aurantiacus]
MANPTRDTTAGRVYNDLRNLARRTSQSTDEIMVEYVLERFLYRLAASPLGRAFPGTETETIHRIAAIAATEIDDGVVFDPTTLKTVPIREEDEYHGLRLSMAASIARARLKLQLDVSFGDPVTPGPRIIDYQQQLTTESFQILSYPLATVIAEKLSTAVSLGDLNTRDRDYGDL